MYPKQDHVSSFTNASLNIETGLDLIKDSQEKVPEHIPCALQMGRNKGAKRMEDKKEKKRRSVL